MKIARDHIVTLSYIVETDDGREIERMGFDDQIFRYVHGYDVMLHALEEKLEGLEPGTEIRVDLKAAQAYGELDRDLISAVPRSELPEFPDFVKIEPGAVLPAVDQDGKGYFMTVRKVDDKMVVVDANHPLAGRDLTFKIKIKEVRKGKTEELKAILGSKYRAN